MKLGAASLLLAFFTPLLAVNGAAHEKTRLPAMKSMHDQSDTVIKILKRQLDCPYGEYHTNDRCCKLCPAGTHKSSDCSQEHGPPQCTPCQEGTYMNIPNHDAECHRCTLCDHGEGFEMDENCTRDKNTICRCIEHYFCNATPLCKHCEPCDKCENGYVLEECTRRKNTVCQDHHPLPAYAIALIVILLIAVAAAIAGYLWWRKKNSPPLDQPANEEAAPLYNDVDLEPHFTDIAKELILDAVLSFVRKNGMSEPTIEEINQDNVMNTNENKIKLLSRWYQKHGQRGAFSTLINTLNENGYRVPSEKISEKIRSSAGYRMAANSCEPDEENTV